MLDNYVKMILRAPVYDVARETPLDLAPAISRRLGNASLDFGLGNQPDLNHGTELLSGAREIVSGSGGGPASARSGRAAGLGVAR